MHHSFATIANSLIQQNRLKPQEYEVLVMEEKISGRSLSSLMLEIGLISEHELMMCMAEIWQCPVVSLLDYPEIHALGGAWLDYEVMESCLALPLVYDEDSGTLTLAIGDISDAASKENIRQNLKKSAQINFVLSRPSEILNTLRTMAPKMNIDTNHHKNVKNQVVHEFLYELLSDAVSKGASDIHFEPEKFALRLRYRYDGLLQVAQTFHISFWQSLCVQLKVLASMDIAESRRPQDGRFSLSFFGRSVDFRASVHPTLYGENIVLRILDQERTLMSLEHLGYTSDQLLQLKHLIEKPEGLIILTGPTGSGKTTSLYSMLSMLDCTALNIMTLEEPIECHLPGIRQTEIRDSSLLSFSTGVHSILRQDPDVILIGEIRDEKTAEMALRASMTGHLVFTTLHTIHALGALYRLKELSINPSLISGLINGIVAQRLVRLLCPACKIPQELSEIRAQEMGLWPQCSIWQAKEKGCSECLFSGYKGRFTVAEILIMTPWIEELFLNQAPYEEVQRALAHEGFRGLKFRALEAVLQGRTSLAEIQRVVGGTYGVL